MNTSYFLETKFQLPQPGTKLVNRQRLVERLRDEQLATIVLVAAPAGYGKTTVVVDLLQSEAAQHRVAWLSLDPDDSQIERFLTCLILACTRLGEGIGESALALMRSSPPQPQKLVLTVLLNDLARLESPFILVLDDYHVIEEASVHELMIMFLEHLPAHGHVVITSRSDPPLPLARWRARRMLVELRADDLRFTLNETAVFFNQIMDIPLEPADLMLLDQRTEGWIASMQLAAISMRKETDTSAFIRTFSGSNRYIVDYLLDEILDRLPAETHDFLLKTALLSQFCAPLCDAMLERVDSEDQIAELEARNLFLIALDHERRWYRYHHLFADVLRMRLRRQPTLDEATLARRAAAWYAAHGYVDEALHTWLQAGDVEAAASYLEQQANSVLDRNGYPALLYWLEHPSFTDDILKDHPLLLLVFILILGVRAGGRTISFQDRAIAPQVTRLMQLVKQAIERLPPGDMRREVFSAQLKMFEAVHADPNLWNIHDAIALTEESVDALRGHAPLAFCVASIQLGILYIGVKAYPEARRHLIEAVEVAQEHRLTEAYMRASLEVIGLDMALGRVSAAAQSARNALETVQAWKRDNYPSAAMIHIALCVAALIHLDIPAARVHAEQAAMLADRLGLGYLRIAAYRNLLSIHYLTGDLDRVADILQNLDRLRVEGDTVTRLGAEELFMLYSMRTGQPEHALKWVRRQHPRLSDTVDPIRRRLQEGNDGNEFLTLLEIILFDLQHTSSLGITPAQAMDMARQLYQVGVEYQFQLVQLKYLILSAMLYEIDHQQPEANECLTLAVSLAAPERLALYFIEAGAAIVPLLRRIEPPSEAQSFVDALLTRLDREAQPASPREAVLSNGEFESLTAREQEIFVLVADGLSNREIASSLYLSVGTVKRHIANIFIKLGAESRTHALAIAREHGLL